MKKIKIIMLLPVLLLITGCDFNYDLEITSDGIKEINTVWFNQDELIDNDVTTTVYNISSKYFINDDHLIANETNIINDNDKSGYQTIDNRSINDIGDLKSLNLCYENIKVISTEKKVGVKTSNEFLCFDYYEKLENVTVHIKSDLKCIDCNADKVDGNNYYWYINKSNSYNKTINAVFRKNYSTIKFIFPLICAIILIVDFLIVFTIRSKQQKVNEI